MDLQLAEKRFLVCGGSRGLGRAVADTLLAEGARVRVVAREVAGLEAAGFEATAADLALPDGIATVVAAIRAGGAIDGVLVNSGGPAPGEALALDDEQWQSAVDLLLLGPIRLLRALEGDLTEQSAILFVTSSSVRQPIPSLDTSNVLRPAVAALVKTLALQLGPRTRVNSIAPGRFDTERVRQPDTGRAARAGISPEQQRQKTA